jgi:hypothetical protein
MMDWKDSAASNPRTFVVPDWLLKSQQKRLEPETLSIFITAQGSHLDKRIIAEDLFALRGKVAWFGVSNVLIPDSDSGILIHLCLLSY